RESGSDTDGTENLQTRQFIVVAHRTFRDAHIRPAGGSFRLGCSTVANVTEARLVEPIVAKCMRVSEGKNSKAGTARTGKTGNIAGRVQAIAGKRDSLIVISEEEATGKLAVRTQDVVQIGRKLIFVEITRFREDGEPLAREGLRRV